MSKISDIEKEVAELKAKVAWLESKRGTESNTDIARPGQEKFTFPKPPEFHRGEAWWSVISLLLFFVASVSAIVLGKAWPIWTLLPFWFTAIGSAVGFLYELWLVVSKQPYQLFGTPFGRFIQLLRGGNLAPVFGATYLAYFLMTFSQQAGWLGAAAGVLTGFLLVMFFLRGPLLVASSVLLIGLASQLVVLFTANELNGGWQVKSLLAVAAIGLFATTLIGSQTPVRSTWFHVIATAVVALMFYGFKLEFDASDPDQHRVVGLKLRLLAAIPLGAYIAFRTSPSTWAMLRSWLAHATWPFFYLVIAGGMRIPKPDRLSELYKGVEDKLQPLKLMPYYYAHPRNLTHPVSVPCLDEALTLKVHAYGFLTRLVQFAFKAASIVNQYFPFADISVPIRQKPRMEPWSDGSQYWPKWLIKRVYVPRLGWFSIESGVRGPGIQSTPDKAVEAYGDGQLLAYLVEYGIAGAFIKPVDDNGQTRFILDLRFLEVYETKPDYESYGGAAYFEIDDVNHCLRLTEVQAPKSTLKIKANPFDPTFRHAEDMILASIYFYVVSGKHLVEIHMGLNLVEVALFNSFDARKLWYHPVRIALYPHLFAHELAEELTTQNLLEDRAIFPQIFATTNAALVRHLNDRFAEYHLAADEDFELRESRLLAGHPGKTLDEVLPFCSLRWEKRYAALWQSYTSSLVDAMYDSDSAVIEDDSIQLLYANLDAMFPQELPTRYQRFQSKAGLARFMSDTMHHLIIRHEVYGTTGVRLALDPRINKVQVPKDGGPCAVDEWRSLACVAMATSRVRYALLMTDFSNTFNDLKNETLRSKFRMAHTTLKNELRALESEFTSDGIDNYENLRPLPSELDIGAGY